MYQFSYIETVPLEKVSGYEVKKVKWCRTNGLVHSFPASAESTDFDAFAVYGHLRTGLLKSKRVVPLEEFHRSLEDRVAQYVRQLEARRIRRVSLN